MSDLQPVSYTHLETLNDVKNAMKINYFDDKELIEAQSEKYKG